MLWTLPGLDYSTQHRHGVHMSTIPHYFPPGQAVPVPDPTEDRTFILIFPEPERSPFDTFKAQHTKDRSGYSAWAYDPRTTEASNYLVPSSPWASIRISCEDWAWALSAPLGSSRQVGQPSAGNRGSKQGLLVVADRNAWRW